jgi:hypothetical protein
MTEREMVTLHLLRAQATLVLAFFKVLDEPGLAERARRLVADLERSVLECDLLLSGGELGGDS